MDALIIFSKKKDGGLHLCVKYRGLNDKYLLPLKKMQDRSMGAKYYIRLDLKDSYNSIIFQEGMNA